MNIVQKIWSGSWWGTHQWVSSETYLKMLPGEIREKWVLPSVYHGKINPSIVKVNEEYGKAYKRYVRISRIISRIWLVSVACLVLFFALRLLSVIGENSLMAISVALFSGCVALCSILNHQVMARYKAHSEAISEFCSDVSSLGLEFPVGLSEFLIRVESRLLIGAMDVVSAEKHFSQMRVDPSETLENIVALGQRVARNRSAFERLLVVVQRTGVIDRLPSRRSIFEDAMRRYRVS